VGAPQDLQVTAGQVHELEVAQRLDFARGDLVLLDRGYVDFDISIDIVVSIEMHFQELKAR